VRSLLGLQFQKEHISTEVADVTVARTGDNWAVHDVGDSDFDLLAQRAAAARANNHGQPAPKPPPQPAPKLKRASFSSRLSQSIKRVVSKGKSAAAPPAAPPARPPQGARLDDQEMARRFDFAAIKKLAAMTDSGTKVSFTMWDYGGQKVFYTLHHIFLSNNGLYLVVFSMVEVLKNASKAKEYLRFWLNSIRLHAPDAPIVLVGTRADQVASKAERERINHVLRDDLDVGALQTIVENAADNLLFSPVNNNDASPDRAARLRAVVVETASAQAYIRRQVPLTWLKVLDDMTVAKRPHFSFKETALIGAEYGMTDDDTDKMLAALNELGVVVHQVSQTAQAT